MILLLLMGLGLLGLTLYAKWEENNKKKYGVPVTLTVISNRPEIKDIQGEPVVLGYYTEFEFYLQGQRKVETVVYKDELAPGTNLDGIYVQQPDTSYLVAGNSGVHLAKGGFAIGIIASMVFITLYFLLVFECNYVILLGVFLAYFVVLVLLIGHYTKDQKKNSNQIDHNPNNNDMK